MHIKAIKNKSCPGLHINSFRLLVFKTVIPAILSHQNIVCVSIQYLVMYSNFFVHNLLKKHTVITLSAMLLLKVCLCLILFITVSLYKTMIKWLHYIIFAEPGFIYQNIYLFSKNIAENGILLVKKPLNQQYIISLGISSIISIN